MGPVIESRTIIHVDMDAFYASVEQRDRPETRGRPVIVGADPRGRGVVSAASYEARRFGVHSAMPISRAFRLCPEGIFLPVDMDKYAAVSREIMAVLADFTPLVEPLSIDEAFLDVTASRALHGDGAAIAREIKERIRAGVSLTASVGVAPNKFLAKVASELRKPDGLVVVEPGREALFLAPLPVSRLWGVGRVTGAELEAMGHEMLLVGNGALRYRRELEGLGSSVDFASTDLSSGGAFLRADVLFEVGEVLLVEFRLPNGRQIKTQGRVVRVARGGQKDRSSGMGIEFVDLSAEDRAAIDSRTA